MKSISNNASNEIVINKSKFITELIKVFDENDVKEEINKIKYKYKGATHYCYAYIIDNMKKTSDDGEPSGTAGLPILNVLENNNLNYILAIVIRYFGGIKLGAGGLVRSYTKAITTTLEKTRICNLVAGFNLEIEFIYDKLNTINNIIKDFELINKQFEQNITYNILIINEDFEKIKESLILNSVRLSKKENIFIEK